jgi:hypothetical protein
MKRVFAHWLFWYVVGAVLVVTVVVSSLVPAQDLPAVGVNDKIEHFSAYAALTLWFGGLTEPRRYYRLTLWLLAMGGAIEIAQGLMNMGREADWRDFLAGGAGVAAGLLLCLGGLRHWASWIEHWKRR